MIDYLKKNIIAVLIVSILLIGLLIGVYLVKNKQIFKSRANSNIFDSITVSELDPDGNTIQENICQGNDCQTNSKKIRLNINLKKIEDLQNTPSGDN